MHRRSQLTLCLALATGAISLAGQAPRVVPPAAPPTAARAAFERSAFEIKHQKFVLDNGLTLLVHEDHSVPVVGVNLWYHVGSRNEQRGKTGFAHLFEHFFFNGSEHYPRGFREAMDDLGAANRNGTTDTDRTNFFEDVPVSALERTLYLEADRLGFLAAQINQAMLERERGVVQNEKRQGDNQPYGRVFDQIVERIYPASHPYSWPTIGSMDDLNAATLQDVKDWYATFYGPNNCVLSLAGDITAEHALELVTKYFGGIKPGPPLARVDQFVPRLDANLREQMQDRVPQARLYRVYHAPAWRDPALQPLELFASVLSGSPSARLDRALVYDQELATRVTADVYPSELASLVVVTATVKAGIDPVRVEEQLDAAIDQLVTRGPTDAELARARSRILSTFARATERLGGFGGRSDILAQSMTLDGRPDGYLDRLERISRAAAAEVRDTSREWIGAPHYTLVVTPYPALQPGQTTVDRTILPPLGEAPDAAFPPIQRATLTNGLDVMLIERHTVPLVNFALAVDAGYAADTPERAGAASLALGLLDDGTTTKDTFRIADELDAIGARITTASSLDLSFVRLQALAPNVRASLAVYADVVLHPSFPAALVAQAKARRLAQIAQEKVDPIAAARRVVSPLLYGSGHAYGNPLTGSGHERTVSPLTGDDLARWHRDWFHPDNATLIVTGDTTLAALLPELERAFGAWTAGKTPAKRVQPVPPTSGRRVYLIDKPGAPQSVIVAAHVSEAGGQAEDLAIDTVMRNFGGLATSRLNRNLRLDKHWSYGTSGALTDARGQRPFIVIAPVQTDKTKESIAEVIKELQDIAGARPIRGDEFSSIMRTQTLGLPGRFATLASLEAAAIQLLNYGYPDDYFATFGRRVRALGEADLDTAARKFIRPNDVIWIVVGDRAQIEAGIRELNLGEVTPLDGDGNPLGGAATR
ncbi:MAG: insulinase family protein [Luteitalea sp.]|nr:insulinase family protein [Luteitalea sp.]